VSLTKKQKKREQFAQLLESITPINGKPLKKNQGAMELRRANRRVEMRKGRSGK